MLGWMIIFSLMGVSAGLAEVTGAISLVPALAASVIFAVLLVLSGVARMMRGRA